jgi:hypothetical protein
MLDKFKTAYENGNVHAIYTNQIMEIGWRSIYLNEDTIKTLVSFDRFLTGIRINDKTLKLLIGPQKGNDEIFFVKIFDGILSCIPLFYFRRTSEGWIEFKFSSKIYCLYAEEYKITWHDWMGVYDSFEKIIERYFGYPEEEEETYSEKDLTFLSNRFTCICPADIIKRFLEMVATILPLGE